VVTRAHLSETDFRQEFDSIEECLLATFDAGVARIAQVVAVSVQGERRWRTRVRLALASVLRFFDQEPQWARFLLCGAAPLSAALSARREQALARAAELLRLGSPSVAGSEAHPPAGEFTLGSDLTAELVIGGVFSVIQSHVLESRPQPLVELAPSLMSLIVFPYLGADAAGVELARPARVRREKVPAKGKPIRTTYRTARVLAAIGRSPHSSNRDIAAAAGLSDEGQTSRLLARLARQGLIENVGLGHAYGEPNAWVLSESGSDLTDKREGSPWPGGNAQIALQNAGSGPSRRQERGCGAEKT
jgi:IclR helix-turn-helix domain